MNSEKSQTEKAIESLKESMNSREETDDENDVDFDIIGTLEQVCKVFYESNIVLNFYRVISALKLMQTN